MRVCFVAAFLSVPFLRFLVFCFIVNVKHLMHRKHHLSECHTHRTGQHRPGMSESKKNTESTIKREKWSVKQMMRESIEIDSVREALFLCASVQVNV